MPEGDTLYRVADVMRRTLGDDEIVRARGRPGGAQLERVAGARVQAVRTRGKHLLIDFDDGLTLHTHLQMRGSWHRYRPGERWRGRSGDAVAILETAHAVAVCFEAPTVELIETRALELHPVLSKLGPDLLDPDPDIEAAVRRLSRTVASIAEALLDQRLVAGIGNVYRSEVLFLERQDPITAASALPTARLARLLETSRDLLRANVGGGDRVTMPDASGAPPDASAAGSRSHGRWVYGRAGRPCRRCGALVRSRTIGHLPRRLYWCPRCQAGAATSTPVPVR
ncbi:MAG: DNA-formamidopyrimidine glycosylase family protein [Candidatus Limnocylindrales bacterium]